MSRNAEEIELPETLEGDRWIGITRIGPILIEGEQPAVSLARAQMILKLDSGAAYVLDSDGSQNPDAPIVIDNATTWQISIPEVSTGFCPSPGKWRFAIKFYGAGQGADTYFKGTQVVKGNINL